MRAAEPFEFRGSGKLIHFARRCSDLKPAQEAADRRPVARLCIAVARNLGGVLDRFGKDRRVLPEHELRAAFAQRLGNADHAERGIDADTLAGIFAERGGELFAVADRDRVAEVAGQLGRDLFGRDEQVRAAVLPGDDIG